ncbi:hypothetical protein ACFE04_001902 [Oxalis oulophora]
MACSLSFTRHIQWLPPTMMKEMDCSVLTYRKRLWSLLLINIITSSIDFCRLRCVSRRIKELADGKYDVVDLSNHPVCGPGNFIYTSTYFIERCILNGNAEALFSNGIVHLCSWRIVATLCSLEYAASKQHLLATYIFWVTTSGIFEPSTSCEGDGCLNHFNYAMVGCNHLLLDEDFSVK